MSKGFNFSEGKIIGLIVISMILVLVISIIFLVFALRVASLFLLFLG